MSGLTVEALNAARQVVAFMRKHRLNWPVLLGAPQDDDTDYEMNTRP